MQKIDIEIPGKEYPVFIANDYAELGECIMQRCGKGRVIVVTDSNVDRFQSKACVDSLVKAGLDVHKFVFPAGEKKKNLNTVEQIYTFLLNKNTDRNATIVALGGGVTGDIAGFAASTYLRGINFVQVPTTVLSQADSSVGGKVGVDFKGEKNMVGSFYQPKFVYINVKSIETLPTREIRAGLAEVIKHGIIRDASFFEYVSANIEKVFNFDNETLQEIAKKDCLIKGAVVAEDEKEAGLRAILNFGHTIGHAIESALNFKLLHGECVSIGMIASFNMAIMLGMTTEDEKMKAIETLEKAGLPTKLLYLDVDKIYSHMLHDKKIRNGMFKFVLPEKIGEVTFYETNDRNLIMNVLKTLK